LLCDYVVALLNVLYDLKNLFNKNGS
jgi:hypothetical protein